MVKLWGWLVPKDTGLRPVGHTSRVVSESVGYLRASGHKCTVWAKSGVEGFRQYM